MRSSASAETMLPEPEPLFGIESGGRLVEHQQARAPSRACAISTRRRIPPDSLRICAPASRSRPTSEHPTDLVVAGPPVGLLLEDRHVVDEVERGEAAVETRLLWQVAQAPPDRMRPRRRRRVVPEQPDPSAVRGSTVAMIRISVVLPGCGRSLRAITRMPGGQPVRSSRPVSSTTQAPSRTSSCTGVVVDVPPP